MVHAFVMVKAEAGETERLVDAIREVERVLEAYVVAGTYDIIAEVEADEVYEILGAAAEGIRSLEGVTDTRTYIAMG